MWPSPERDAQKHTLQFYQFRRGIVFILCSRVYSNSSLIFTFNLWVRALISTPDATAFSSLLQCAAHMVDSLWLLPTSALCQHVVYVLLKMSLHFQVLTACGRFIFFRFHPHMLCYTPVYSYTGKPRFVLYCLQPAIVKKQKTLGSCCHLEISGKRIARCTKFTVQFQM